MAGRRRTPPNPGAWLTTTANRKAVDRIRRENKRDDKHKEAQMVYDNTPPQPLGAIDDDRLRLIFTCCHPALAMEARVALTLRMLGGLTVPEIARAFLNPRQLRTWAPRRPGRHGMRAGALVACLACRSGRTRRGCDAGRHRSGHGGEREAGTGDIPRRRHRRWVRPETAGQPIDRSFCGGRRRVGIALNTAT